ncbi:CU044_5270 family protein [Actinomadura sp. WAC 06369]|uniref:CU044_5270 family protein n=1 Tax=Actinomadura sp. WAC 06369 TaxID=2203193 RepID=UPI001F386448|nr:CU044_5270 family protein [Actinomadura sp. WAC 06369]
MTEIDRLVEFRAEVPESPELAAEEARLRAAIAGERGTAAGGARRRFRLRGRTALAGALAAGAVAAGAVIAAVDAPAPGAPDPIVRTMPVAHVRVLQQAADRAADAPELHPRPGQFLVIESRMMNTAEDNGADGQVRYLYRVERTLWAPYEGDSTRAVLRTTVLPPKQWPGRPLPEAARQGVGETSTEKAADFDGRAEWLRTDYAYLSKLPTEAEGMYAHLYTGLGTGREADAQAWQNLGGMLTEAYMPAAQRAALFRAAAAIPGVTTVGKAVDAAGRTGVAVALDVPGTGIRTEYIFDPDTYDYLGERGVVTDASRAQAPVGSVLAATAQLSVRVADAPPPVS